MTGLHHTFLDLHMVVTPCYTQLTAHLLRDVSPTQPKATQPGPHQIAAPHRNASYAPTILGDSLVYCRPPLKAQ